MLRLESDSNSSSNFSKLLQSKSEEVVWNQRELTTEDMILIGGYFVVIFIGMTGNSLVIHAVRRNRSMHTTTNYLIANIAVADLLTMATCLPFVFMKFFKHPSGPFGRFLCTFITKNNVSSITVTVSTLTLCTLAVERYNALLNPLKQRLLMSKKTTIYAIFMSWALAVLAAMPLLIFTDFNKDRQFCQFTFKTQTYWIAIGAATFLIFTAICYCYIKILREIYHKRLLVIGNYSPQWLNIETVKNKKKVTKLLLSLTLAFVVFFVPRMIYLFFSPLMTTSINLSLFRKLSFFLVICNSCVNPIICAFQSENYRRAFLTMLRRSTLVDSLSRHVVRREERERAQEARETRF